MIKIDTSAAQEFSKKLKAASKSAFPVAVRTALNSAAYDVKKNTLQRSVEEKFVKRSPNFFKANSRVIQAQGFNINQMESTIGMMDVNLQGKNNYAVKDLDQQEHGGQINRKAFIPLNAARAGKSLNKNVRPVNRLTAITRIIDARKSQGVSDKQKFVRSIYVAGVGGYVLAKNHGKMILWRIDSLTKSGPLKYKLTALYSYQPKRSVAVKGTHFMESAAIKSKVKIPYFFNESAKKKLTQLGILK